MNDVQIGHINRRLPSSWDELTRDQLICVAELLKGDITVVDYKVRLLFKFLKVKWKVFKRISSEDAYALGETLSFLVNQEVKLTKNLIPIICRLYGPDDSLKNITFGEFVRLQMITDRYSKDKQDKYLDELVAVIYRRRKFGWILRRYLTDKTDCRLPLIDRTIEKRTRVICRRINPAVKYAILLFVTGVFNTLPDRFPNVFKTKSEKEKKDGGWIDVIISLADGKTDDDSLERIYRSNMYNVFYGLEKQAADYAKFKNEHPDYFKNKDHD